MICVCNTLYHRQLLSNGLFISCNCENTQHFIYISYNISLPLELRGCRGRDHMVVGFTMQMQLEPNTTNIVSSNLAQMRCALYDTK
jgi:hypothetical protein